MKLPPHPGSYRAPEKCAYNVYIRTLKLEGKPLAPAAPAKGLGLTGYPLYSALWYLEFLAWGCRLKLSEGEERYEFTPAWITLPLQRRAIALSRREEILAYEAIAQPGDGDARAAAARLGITVSHFYTLLRRWNQRRSIFVLTPYFEREAPAGKRLDPAVASEVRRHITQAIDVEGLRSAAAILRRIHEEWHIPQPIPSHMTLRKNIAAALASFEGVPGKFITVSSALLPKEVIESAKAFGDAVVIDHTAPAIFVSGKDGPYIPLITLVIDVHTASVLGRSISVMPPQPGAVVRAMQDAVNRSIQATQFGDEDVEPDLVFAAATGKEWNALIEMVHRGGFAAHIRRGTKLHYGALVSQLIGTSLGDLKLSQRKAHGRLPDFDPAKDALVRPAQFEKLLDYGIKALNEKRFAPEMQQRALCLPTPEFSVTAISARHECAPLC